MSMGRSERSRRVEELGSPAHSDPMRMSIPETVLATLKRKSLAAAARLVDQSLRSGRVDSAESKRTPMALGRVRFDMIASSKRNDRNETDGGSRY